MPPEKSVTQIINEANERAARLELIGDRELASLVRSRATRAAIPDLAEAESKGLFNTVLSALQVPGQKLRGLLTGRGLGGEATPRELLAALGIEPETKFDIRSPISTLPAGLSVLLTDILTDPLTFVAGIGALSKGAKATKTLASLRQAGKVARGSKASPLLRESAEQVSKRQAQVRKQLEILQGLGKSPREVARELQLARPTGALPAAAQERRLLQVGAPFTSQRLPIPIPGEQLAIGALRGAGNLPGIRQGREAIGQAFSQTARLGQTALATRLGLTAKGRARGKAIRTALDLGKEQEALIRARTAANPSLTFDQHVDEFFSDIRLIRETRDVIRRPGASLTTKSLRGQVIRKKVAQEELDFAQKLDGLVDDAFEQQVLAGARSEDAITDYAERILTPESRAALQRAGSYDEYLDFVRNRSSQFDNVRDPSQIRRADYTRDMLTEDVNQFFRDKGLDVEFNLNPAQTVAETILARDISVIHADLARSFIKEFAGVPGRAGGIRVSAFLKKTGLKRFEGIKIGKDQSEAIIAKNLAAKGIKNDILPGEVVTAFADIDRVFNPANSSTFGKFLGFYDSILSAMRFSVTSPFPAFHFRNFTSNIILNFLGGVPPNPALYTKAMVHAIKSDPKLSEFAQRRMPQSLAKLGGEVDFAFDPKLHDLYSGGVLRGQVQTLGEELGRAITATGSSRLQNLSTRLKGSAVVKVPFLASQMTEDIGRIAHFIHRQSKGDTFEQALSSVNKFLFDYSSDALTPIEREVNNRLFFFYRWTRFAVPLLLRSFLDFPNRAAIALKATAAPSVERPGGLPEFAKEQASIPVGRTPEGEIDVLSGVGSPFEELQKFDFLAKRDPGIFGGFGEAFQEFLNLLNPMLKAPIEIASGEDFFFERPLQELTKSPIDLPIPGIVERQETERGLRFNIDPTLRFLLGQPPVARFINTANQLVGERKGVFRGGAEAPGGLLRLLTGARINRFDEPLEEARAAERVLRRGLLQSGEAREGQFVFAPGGIDQASPQTQKSLRLLNQIIQQRRKL